MEDQIRDGYDYEMTIAFEIINDQHMARPAKDRTGLFADKPEFPTDYTESLSMPLQTLSSA